MMATLIRMRPVSLLLFTFGTIGFIALVTRDTPTASVVAAFTAYFGLTAFVVTEAFGEPSSKRTKFNRWTARLFLVPCALCATYLAVAISWIALS